MAPSWPVSISVSIQSGNLGLIDIYHVPSGILSCSKVGKGFYFFPLKDSYGTVQLVVPSDADPEMLALMRDIPLESTVLVEGTVHERPATQKRSVSTSRAADVALIADSIT